MKNREHLRTLVISKNRCRFVVDSCEIRDCCYETMAFQADGNGNPINGIAIMENRYSTVKEMELGHRNICKKIANKTNYLPETY